MKEQMKDLIPIVTTAIGKRETLTCNARELHAFLCSETRFNDWIARRIDKYELKENIDFVRYSNLSNPKTIEYTLCIDTAKELAMVENNDKGRQVRRYFIECERLAKESAGKAPKAKLADNVHARSLAVTLRQMARLKGVYPDTMRAVFLAKAASALSNEPVTEYLPPVTNGRDRWQSPTQLAETLGMSKNSVGKLLKALGLHGEYDEAHAHSEPIYNKSPYSNREVISYLYNPDIVLPKLTEATTAMAGAITLVS